MKHFSRAIALGASGWKTYWDYARLMGPGAGDSAYVDALRKTVQLNPDLFDARLALGSEWIRQRSWARALIPLRAIRNIDAEHASDLFLMLAFCELNLDLKEDAKTHAESFRKYAKDARQQEEAGRLIAFLENRPGATPVEPGPVPDAAPADARPMLRRQHPAPTAASVSQPAQPQSLTAKGKFKRLDCLGVMARMHLMDGGNELVLLIRKPDEVTIQGGAGAIELKCGLQNASVSVDYLPSKDEKLGTAGEVRKIEFIE